MLMFSDWVFYSRVTEDIIPSNIELESENAVPLVGAGSLRIKDLGAPAVATVTALPKPALFDTKVEIGRIRTVFKKLNGSGFQDQGLFFLSSGNNPTKNKVKVYVLYYSSGSTTVRLMKYTSGLHNTTGTLLQSYVVPFSGSDEPIVIEADWKGGLLTNFNGYTEITIKYGSNTTNFSNLVTLSPVVQDTIGPFTTGRVGIFVRSRNQVEPLNSLIDMTEIYREDLA